VTAFLLVGISAEGNASEQCYLGSSAEYFEVTVDQTVMKISQQFHPSATASPKTVFGEALPLGREPRAVASVGKQHLVTTPVTKIAPLDLLATAGGSYRGYVMSDED